MVKKLLLFGLLFMLFLGCAKLDPKIDAPSYLQIDDYNTITDSITQGTNNQKFTDVLVTTTTQSYGYYPMPGKTPLPLSGSTFLIMRPVIKVNGVSALRVDYPMMKGCDTTVQLVKGKITKFTPVFKYFSSVNFRFLEDFEGVFNKMKNFNPTDTFGVTIDTTQKFYGGKKCLAMHLDATHPKCTSQSTFAFQLPYNGTSVFLEINYMSNSAFEVGVSGTSFTAGVFDENNSRSAGGCLASPTWKKMYFSLTDILSAPPHNLPYFYVYFYSTYNGTGLNQIYIDNVKVISLQ